MTAVAAPLNDKFADAFELMGVSSMTNGTIEDATTEAGEPRYHAVGENSVWYLWTAPAGGQATFELMGPSADAVVAVYTGASVGSLLPVNFGPVSSCASFFAAVGTPYRIAVSGSTSASTPGPFVLNWRFGDGAAVGVPFAGQFGFSSADFFATEYEFGQSGLRDPVLPNGVRLQRSAGGAVITVNRTGGSAGRVLVDYRTMEEVATDWIGVAILNVTNIVDDSMPGSTNVINYTNEGNITIYYTNAYTRSTLGILSEIILTNWVANTNLCGGMATSCSLSTNVLINCQPDSFAGIACPFNDYFPASGTLVFDEFETSKRFLIEVTTDFLPSGNKQMKLELFNPRLAEEETNNPTGTIPPTRNCPLSIANLNIIEVVPGLNGGTNFSIERVSYAVNEINTVGANNSITVDIIHPSGTGGEVVVHVVGSDEEFRYFPFPGSDYATETNRIFDSPLFTDGTTNLVTAQDFVASTTRLNFGQNQRRQTITIPIFDDTEVEFNEDIYVYLEYGGGSNPPLGANRFARVTILDNDQPAGALDRDWNPDDVSYTTPRFNLTPGANNIVRAVAVQADQRTVIGGDFTAYNSVPRNRIARINPDGSLDASFNPGTGADGFVSSLAIYRNTSTGNDGKTVVGGGFTSLNNVQRNGVARLNVNGSLDTTFNPGSGANGVVYSVAIQSDGKVLVAGDFTEFNNVSRPGVVRLNANGSVDSTFDPGAGADDVVWSVGVRDGNQSIFVPRAAEGNEFEDVNEIEVGATQGTIVIDYDFINIVDNIRVYYEGNRIFDLTTNGIGQLMIPFGPGNSTKVTIILNEGTGEPGTLWFYRATISVPAVARKIFIGGEFLNFDGEFRGGIARLEEDGSLDLGFNPGAGADGPVYVVAPQADGRLLVGGAFGAVNFNARHRLARLNFDGTVDDSYNQGGGPNDSVYAIALQPDGKALVGGVFTIFNHTRRLGLARLFSNGTVDTSFLDTAYNGFAGLINTFHFQPANYVNAIALQTNGGVMIGGSFTNLGGHFALNANDLVPWVRTFNWPFGGVIGNVTGWHRAEKHPRFNVARLIGGYTPGPGNVEFVFGQNTVDENAGSLTVALRRLDGRLGTVGAQAGTTNNLAMSGADFESAFSPVFWFEDFFLDEPISVGDVTESFFSVPITDDTAIEGDELFGLGLTLPFGSINLNGEVIPLGTALGRSAATVTIADNDFNHGVLAFSSPTYFTNENSGVAHITVVRTNGSSGLVTVRYFTRDIAGSALAGQDYTFTQGTLTFGSGVTSQSFDVPIFNDNLREDDEVFSIVLTNATGGATLPGGLPTSTNATLVTIIDNDLLSGKANFASAAFAENEGAGVAQITLARLGGSVGELRVSAAATTGTATAGNDFTGVTNTITWVHGDVAPKILQVPLLDDLAVEGNETVNLRLDNPSPAGATGSVNVATLTIVEDDFFGALSFSQQFYDADERGSNAVITVVRTGGSGGTVSVDYEIENGTGTNGIDFIASNGTLTFGPGVVATNFQITILDDFGLQDEGGQRTVLLHLTNPINAVLGAVPDATLRIIDDESVGEPAGSLDTTFNAGAGANEAVNALTLQPDGKILAAGAFNTMNRVFRSRVARLEASGLLDGLFNAGAGPDRPVRAMLLQPDGRILIGGLFEQVHGTNRNHIARLLADGSVDVFFNPGAGADNPVFALGLLSDGGVVLGGAFAAVNGVSLPGIAVLNADGSLRATFDPGEGVNGTVFAIAVQNDGKILIGGEFDSVVGVARSNVARLRADGSVDLSFDPGTGPDGIVNAIAIQTDGRILIGGTFTQVAGQPRSRLARLEANGTLDPAFQASSEGADANVLGLALQFDGKIIVVGEFTRFNDVSRNRITRLYPDGATDATINFGEGANDAIHTVVIQPDRKIVIGGRFTTFDGQPRNRIARLHGGSIAGPGVFQFSTPFYEVHETNATAVITVQRRGGTTGSATVDYASMAGSATPDSDYSDVSGTLVFGEGETTMTFAVPLVNDNIGELEEDVILSLSNPTGGAALGDIPTALLTIISDDANIGFSSALYTVNENVAGGDLIVTVLRTGATNSEARVNFATTNGTARASSDYLAVSGVLTFAPGQTTQTFSVPIIDDSLIEPSETFGLLLSNVVGSVALGQAAATATILDDDFDAGSLTFSATAYSVAEGAGNTVITILRTNGSTGVITVGYATAGDTATPGSDFTSRNGTLTFLEGQTVQTIVIPIINDSAIEGDEDFTVSLFSPTGGAIISGLATAVVTIQDDDFGPGSLDLTFDPGLGANGLVRTVAVQPSGKVLIGGAFTEFDGLPRSYVARLEQDGSLDFNFDPAEGPDAFVAAVASGPVDKVLLGGSFDMLGAVGFNRLAQLNDDGTPDLKFNRAVGLNAAVFALGIQTNGRILVGGAFSLPSRGISRLHANGSVDASFAVGSGANGAVHAAVEAPGGSIVLAGAFTTVSGEARSRVARLTSAGVLDTSFGTGAIAEGTVFSVAVQADGKLVVVGDFRVTGSSNRTRIARLNTDGSLDTSFDVGLGANATVYAVGLQSSGKVVIAGDFTSIDGSSRNRYARLNPDGSLDATFDPGRGANNTIFSLVVLPDDNVVIGGDFTLITGVPRQGVARLRAADPAPLALGGFAQAGGQFAITVPTQAGKTYVLQASRNLVTWTSIATNTAAGGTWMFTDANMATTEARFFRVVEQ